jgi:flagellar biosynthesis chaperone FliJ
MLLLAGCQSNQQVDCQQQKQKLEETVRTQQAQIDELQQNAEATRQILFQVTTQLKECEGLHPTKAEVEQKEDAKLTKRLEPKRVPRTRTNPKPRPKTSTTKKKGGCPCKRRRRTK